MVRPRFVRHRLFEQIRHANRLIAWLGQQATRLGITSEEVFNELKSGKTYKEVENTDPQPSGQPVNSVLPAITGNIVVGEALTASNGTWTGAVSYARQWLRDGSSISSATGTTYVLVEADIGAMISVRVTATNTEGSTPATSATVGPIEDVPVVDTPPSNSSAPVISGTAAVGQELTTTNGTWTGTVPITYTYQWRRDAANISGATNAAYTVVSGDIGADIACAVTATNVAGSDTAISNELGPVPVPVPVNTVAPAVTGTAQVGETLTATNGTWTGTGPITYSYQWKWDNGSPNGGSISGATSGTYVIDGAFEGMELFCTVTATNAGGGASAHSNQVGPVTAAPESAFFTDNVEGRASVMPYSQGGMAYSGAAFVSIETAAPIHGTQSLKFHYPGTATGEDSNAELAFDKRNGGSDPGIGRNLTEFSWRFALLLPSNWEHRAEGGENNNKFFYLWSGEYSAALSHQTLGVEYWRDSSGTSILGFRWGCNGQNGNFTGSVDQPFWWSEDASWSGTDSDSMFRADSPGKIHQFMVTGKLASAPGVNDGWFHIERWIEGDGAAEVVLDVQGWPYVAAGNYIDQGYLLGWSNSGFTNDTDVLVDCIELLETHTGGTWVPWNEFNTQSLPTLYRQAHFGFGADGDSPVDPTDGVESANTGTLISTDRALFGTRSLECALIVDREFWGPVITIKTPRAVVPGPIDTGHTIWVRWTVWQPAGFDIATGDGGMKFFRAIAMAAGEVPVASMTSQLWGTGPTQTGLRTEYEGDIPDTQTFTPDGGWVDRWVVYEAVVYLHATEGYFKHYVDGVKRGEVLGMNTIGDADWRQLHLRWFDFFNNGSPAIQSMWIGSIDIAGSWVASPTNSDGDGGVYLGMADLPI